MNLAIARRTDCSVTPSWRAISRSASPLVDVNPIADEPLLLSKHPGSDLSPRKSGCYWLPGLAVGDGVAAGAGVWFQVSMRIFQTSPSRV